MLAFAVTDYQLQVDLQTI